jgi:Leucine-rich repeat (LRR) protein
LDKRFLKSSSKGIYEIDLYGRMIKLKSFPMEFNKLRNLKSLRISNFAEDKDPVYIPEKLEGFDNLEYLEIGEGITGIFPGILNLKNLKYLGISEAGLKEIPPILVFIWKSLRNTSKRNLRTSKIKRIINEIHKYKIFTRKF